MRAMILAAGLGTRLRPITDELPKALVPVVGVPNIIRIVNHLRNAGIREIVINTYHLGAQIVNALGNGNSLDVDITYSHEKELLGTGGGIKKALPLLGKSTFWVINSDSVFMPDMLSAYEEHKKRDALATMLVRQDEQHQSVGSVGLDRKNRIRYLVCAGEPSLVDRTFMFSGWHILEPAIGPRLPEKGCIVRKSYIPMVEKKEQLVGLPSAGYFCDLGTPARYLRANIKLVTGQEKIEGFTASPDGVHVDSGVILGEGCQLGSGTVVCKNARISAGISLKRCVIFEGAQVKQDLEDSIVTSSGVIVGPVATQDSYFFG